MSRQALVLLLACGFAAGPAGAQAPAVSPPEGAARLDASVSADPVVLPQKKGGQRELTFAFGKRSTAKELSRLAEEALIDRAYFARRARTGEPDYRLALSLDHARSSHRDFGEWQSRSSTYEVRAEVAYRWLDATGVSVSEGKVDSSASVSLEGSPRRSDAARAWARLIDDAVARAFGEAFQAAAFGNEPPPPGGWVTDPP